MPACCAAAGREFKRPMFDTEEEDAAPPSDEAVATKGPRRLDVVQTFSPRPRLPYIGAKVFIMAWIISTLVLSVKNKTHPEFWM